jgi:hypothetical protein
VNLLTIIAHFAYSLHSLRNNVPHLKTIFLESVISMLKQSSGKFKSVVDIWFLKVLHYWKLVRSQLHVIFQYSVHTRNTGVFFAALISINMADTFLRSFCYWSLHFTDKIINSSDEHSKIVLLLWLIFLHLLLYNFWLYILVIV